ncbi:hypothetical protein PPL_02662 [Heterostelium album PN500]|uniref:VASt domain-containing protein n=1 Tax=Heterostelium pallidum (strain ATCC 26659 / Pp 5 / PN500) TaxID=670386 RepID=D3B2P8_HETP5|nr:hypothetical protein PPL_02662 [Heterostelium album PN500]EFA83596.1 hypothetical protein PPL_02662 [Heterostelium album PN500]|eukprot:XP_020435713.1 hypothetical protein PPL_02662 [Heterostelium album PN500]
MTVAVKDENSFHQIFQSIPNDENCSYTDGGSVSIGRLYISQQHVSYAPKLGSTQIIIPIKDITNISKKYSVYLFPNAIEVCTSTQKYFFSAFLSRDLAFATLQTLFQQGGGTRTKIFEDAMNGIIYDEKTATSAIKSSDDEQEHEPFQDTPTVSSFVPTSSSLSSSTSQFPEPLTQSANNSESTSQTNSSGSNSPPKSQSPSIKMLNSTIDSSKEQSNGDSQSNGQTPVELDENLVVGNQPNEESTPTTTSTSTSTTTSNSNTTSNTTPTTQSSSSLPSTPKKADSQLNLNESLSSSTPNKQTTSQQTTTATQQQQQQQQPPQQQTSKSSPIQKRKNTVDSLPTQQQQQQQQQNSAAPSPLRHTISYIFTHLYTKQCTASTGATSSPSPASVAVSNTLQFKSIPIKDKCEHIVSSEFEEAPWATEKYPISVEEFYNVIIRTDFWALVNTTHGYTEQSVNEWKNGSCCTTRTMDFRTAISFKIGPKSTRVYQTQRCRLRNKDELLLQCSSVSKDVPYGDSFSVENLFSIASDDGGNGCTVKLSSKIKFTKTLWGIASMIQKSAYQGNKDYFVLWFSMVRNQIEAYTYNKLKQAKSAIPDPTTSSATTVTEQTVPQPTTTTSTTSTSTTPTTQENVSTQTNQEATTSNQPKENETTSTHTSVPTNLSLTTLWKNLSSTEKQISLLVVALISILFIGLVINVYSTSRTNQWLNQELYKFSDSVVLLDSKLNSLIEGKSPERGDVVIANGNIGTDRLEILQKKLDIASALLQRTQSVISNLQGELSIEALKVKKFEEISTSSGSWSPYILTLLVLVGSALHFTGVLRTFLP